MRDLSLLAILLCMLHTAFSKLRCGRCPDLSVQQNFDLEEYSGRWYELAGYNTQAFEGNKRCVYADYVFNNTNGIFYVQNRGISQRTNTWGGIDGTAVFSDPNKQEGKLTVTFPIWWFTVKGLYWVLKTDYSKYAVVYTCNNFLLFFHYYSVWLLSRDQRFSTFDVEQRFYNTTLGVLKNHSIDTSIITKSSQDYCSI